MPSSSIHEESNDEWPHCSEACGNAVGLSKQSCVFSVMLCLNFNIIQNENEGFLYFLLFYSVLLHVEILYNTLQKVSNNPISVLKDIQHFEIVINDIKKTLPQVIGNSEPSTKCTA
jgi:hypothetical protein